VVDEISGCIDGYPKYGLLLDHFRLNKFSSPKDGNYKAVREEIQRLVGKAIFQIQEMLRSIIDSLDPDLFLETLSAVDQEKYKSTIQLPDFDDPMFFWTFRNTDFEQWNDPSCS
jgi:hypothetical protein